MVKKVILIFVLSFVLSALLEKILIPLLKRLKIGQKILEIGPSWHIEKQGTPTMGGIAFIISASVCTFVFGLFVGFDKKAVLVALYALANGLIGICDDLIKIKRKRNEGLSATSKFILQLVFAALFIISLISLEAVNTELYIPFLGVSADIGRLYYPFALLLLTGFGNAVNLTDGLDGLCSSVSAVVLVYFSAVFLGTGEELLGTFSVALLGGVIGFLMYNFYPAKVFMGDTGSLYLGGVISALALVYEKNTAVFAVGAVYLWEALSVILQVLYYKMTKKRLFLMAPYHHHLEKRGMSEVKITLGFASVTLVLAAVSYLFV